MFGKLIEFLKGSVTYSISYTYMKLPFPIICYTERSKLCFFSSYFRFDFWRNELLSATYIFVGHKEHFNGFVHFVLVFRELLMWSIRCTDRAVGYISQTKMKILKIIVELLTIIHRSGDEYYLLFTSELASQRARNALFTGVV